MGQRRNREAGSISETSKRVSRQGHPRSVGGRKGISPSECEARCKHEVEALKRFVEHKFGVPYSPVPMIPLLASHSHNVNSYNTTIELRAEEHEKLFTRQAELERKIDELTQKQAEQEEVRLQDLPIPTSTPSHFILESHFEDVVAELRANIANLQKRDQQAAIRRRKGAAKMVVQYDYSATAAHEEIKILRKETSAAFRLTENEFGLLKEQAEAFKAKLE
ncbi:hypothetical protein MMC25_003366 [Agyrium rufum]|nr:hypothetical protein [Agyrium rufum]